MPALEANKIYGYNQDPNLAREHIRGSEAHYRGDWMAGGSYAIEDVVTYAGAWYFCLRGNTGMVPSGEVDEFWSPLVEIGPDESLGDLDDVLSGIQDQIDAINDQIQGILDQIQDILGQINGPGGILDQIQAIKDQIQDILDQIQGIQDQIDAIKDQIQGILDQLDDLWELAQTGTNLGWAAWELAQIGTQHGSLSGLLDDDHPQYFNQARGDARYALQTDIRFHVHDNKPTLDKITEAGGLPIWDGSPWPGGGGGSGTGGVTDHGMLTGLLDDDHPQYFNQVRGDVRYAPLSVQSTAQAAYALAQVGTNTGTAAYNLASSASQTAQSAFTLAQTGTASASSAYALAQTGTIAAASAQSTANSAFSLAQTGTTSAASAYALAQTGTIAAANAQSTANSAFSLAQTGTTSASSAYALAQTGTNAASSAQSTANSAFTLAQAGTNAASSAQFTANSAFTLAQSGTNAAASAQSTANSAFTLAQTGTNNDVLLLPKTEAAATYALLTDSRFHTHTNNSTLDKITESAGLPLWDGSAWPGGSGGGGVNYDDLHVTFDGQGNPPPDTTLTYRAIERACTVTSGALVADLSGSGTIVVLRFTPSGTTLGPPTIMGRLILSSAVQMRDTTLSSWGTTSVSAGDVLAFEVDTTPTNMTWIGVTLGRTVS